MRIIFMSELFLSLCANSQVECQVSDDGTVGSTLYPCTTTHYLHSQVGTIHCTLQTTLKASLIRNRKRYLENIFK